MNLSDFLRSLHFRISALVLFGISIVLTQIPLFNYLGYEFSVVTALTVSLVIGLLIIGFFRSLFSLKAKLTAAEFLTFQKTNLKANLVLLSIPLVVITANTLAVKNCSYFEGLAYYGLIPLVTMIFSAALAGFCALLFKLARTAYVILIVAIGLVHPLWLGYRAPQIYSYNFLYGFFPGFSYDEVLTITPTLVIFRCITLLVSLMVFLLTRFFVEQTELSDNFFKKLISLKRMFSDGLNKEKAALLALAFTLFCAWLFRVDVGFESSPSAIRKKLNTVFRTEHFSIHYAPGSFSDEEIHWVGAEYEFRFQQVAQKLQVPFSGVIESYIYPSEELKRRFVGTGSTNIAKPWRREIHLNKDSWQQVLKHELVHVLAGEFGMPIIRANYRVGLVEGLAMAVEWDFGNRTLHEYAAAMERFGLMKDMTRLISFIGFATQASTVSYVLSGSFCRFLIDRYGLVRLKEVYGGKSFSSVYGKRLEQLMEEWKDFLARITIPEEWKSHVKFYFDRKSIFAKECVRTIARLNGNARREMTRNNPVGAMCLYGVSLKESWNSDAFAGLIRAAYAAARYDTVIQLLDGRLLDTTSLSDIAGLMMLYGDALWAKEDFLSAKKAYETILHFELSESFDEMAASRLAVLSDAKLRFRIHPVFIGIEPDSVKLSVLEQVARESNSPILPFLQAQMLFRMKDYTGARGLLETELTGYENATIGAAREKLLGMCYYRLRMFQNARAHFWQAMNFTMNEASILRLHDWIDRCEWFEANSSKYLDSR